MWFSEVVYLWDKPGSLCVPWLVRLLLWCFYFEAKCERAISYKQILSTMRPYVRHVSLWFYDAKASHSLALCLCQLIHILWCVRVYAEVKLNKHPINHTGFHWWRELWSVIQWKAYKTSLTQWRSYTGARWPYPPLVFALIPVMPPSPKFLWRAQRRLFGKFSTLATFTKFVQMNVLATLKKFLSHSTVDSLENVLAPSCPCSRKILAMALIWPESRMCLNTDAILDCYNICVL